MLRYETVLLGALFWVIFPAAKGSCPSGKIEGYAFCCCKKIYITTPTSSIAAMLSTPFVPSSSITTGSTAAKAANATSISPTTSTNPVAVATMSVSETIIATNASSKVTAVLTTATTHTTQLSSAILLATPTPIYRNDGCFVTEKKFGFYNECYCHYTRFNYTGFNNSNGYYTTNSNAINFDYKCWNLPKPKLYIGGLINTEPELGKKMLVAADLAVEEINKNNLLLPGYELVLLKQNSTKHWISKGSGVLLDYLNQSPKKVALLGPDDNDLAKTVGAIASLRRYKLLQISYGTSSIDLSLDHSTFYPYFFRTKPFLDLLYNKARVAMLGKYSWGKVGLLYSNDAYYRELNNNLRTQLQANRISISIEEEFVTDPYSALEHFKRKDVHVILGSFSGPDTSRVLCAAYKLKMYGPLYVYLFAGYTYLGAIDGCTTEQVKCAARYQFFFSYKEQPCSHNFAVNYKERLNNTFFNTSINPIANTNQLNYGKYIYDAIYVIANVLHEVDPDKGNSSRFWLSYVYGSNLYGKLLRDKVLLYNKCGASGTVKFDVDGNRHYPISIIQIRFGGYDLIAGSFDNSRVVDKLQLPSIRWPGKNIPYKEVTRVNYWRYISKGLYIAYCVFAGLGIIFALFCLFVLIWRRKHKEIRYSFYPLNIIIIIGCILVYISVFLFGVDNIISPVITVDRICRARLWVFSLGFVLVVGSLIAKLWVVHDVLSTRMLMEKKRRRRIMYGIVFVTLLITIIILLCWHFVNPLKRVIVYITDEVKYYCDTDIWPDNPFSIKVTAVEQCKCANEIVWYFVIVIWKALLIILSVYWAYQTRDVFIPTINDTQRCGLCSYVIAVCCIIGLIIALTTRLFPDIFFGLVGIIIIGCVTAVLIILFLHKILLVFSCSRNRVVVKSATEEDDDAGCFSRCLSKCRCGGAYCGCCTLCCKGNCPKCYLCLAACCAPFLLCCAPLLLCCSKLFACCGSSCRNCCCGSKSQRNGSGKVGEQKFIVKGIGDDRSAEIARLQRELDMKNKYIQQMRGNELPAVRRIWTQTTEPIVLLSDTCDEDSDDDGNDKVGGNGSKRRPKKKKRFRVFNRKLDFSDIKSRTDSNYNGGKGLPAGKGGSKKNRFPAEKDKKKQNDENGNIPMVFIDTGRPKDNDAEVAKLKKLLADRDAEIERLKNKKGNKNGYGMPEIDESLEKDMVQGLGFPAKDRNPHTVVLVAPDTGVPKNNKHDKSLGTSDDDDIDAVLRELDGDTTPRSSYNRKKSKLKIYQQKLDWSQIPSKLRAAGLLHLKEPAGPSDGTEGSPSRINKVSPEQNNTTAEVSPTSDPQTNSGKYNNNRRYSNLRIFHENIDYSQIQSKVKPFMTHDSPRPSLSSSDTGSVRILNHPSEYNRKYRSGSMSSSGSLNKPDLSRSDSNRLLNRPKVRSLPDFQADPRTRETRDEPEKQVTNTSSNPNNPPKSIETSLPDKSNDPGKQAGPSADKPIENPKSEVKIVNDPKDYSHIQSKLNPDPPPTLKLDKPLEPNVAEKPKSDVKILNDPKDYSHVKSKLIPDLSPTTRLDKPADPNSAERRKSDVKILNDPKDYSHVKSKLIPDSSPTTRLDKPTDPNAVDRRKSDVKILNDPKDYSHVKSKLIPDSSPTSRLDKPTDPNAAERRKSDVRILNDPKDYSHVKSKLIPDPPAKQNPQKAGESSPRDKPGTAVRILNAPKDYSHVTSKLPTAGPEPKKSTVKITNRPADYSHVKSKLG